MELKGKYLDFIVGIVYFALSTFFILFLKLNSLITTFLYLVIPSVYFLIKYERFRKRILLFALPLGIIGSIFSQYIGESNGAWFWDSPTIRLATYIHLESIIWGVAYVTVILSLYKIYFDFRHSYNLHGNYNGFLLMLFSGFLLVLVWVFSDHPKVEYAYAKFLAIPMTAPIIYALVKKPDLLPKLLKITLFFSIFSVIYELVALKLRYWWFPGEYIGFVNIFGFIFPIEEFILFLVLGGASIASLYEDFDEV